jgi:siroheme decarboxylase
MDKLDYELLFELKNGLPVSADPFRAIADRLQLSPFEIIQRILTLQKIGVIRRFGACIKPVDIGFFANALVAWRVDENRMREVGSYLSTLKEITHCYKRKPVIGKWEYNLYTVMHAQKRETIEQMVKDISDKIAVSDFQILYSIKNLKKTAIKNKVRYSSQNFELEVTGK